MMQMKEQEVYFALQGKHSYGNIFVTKKIFFQEEASTRFFDLHISCIPSRVAANQRIFKSGLNS